MKNEITPWVEQFNQLLENGEHTNQIVIGVLQHYLETSYNHCGYSHIKHNVTKYSVTHEHRWANTSHWHERRGDAKRLYIYAYVDNVDNDTIDTHRMSAKTVKKFIRRRKKLV